MGVYIPVSLPSEDAPADPPRQTAEMALLRSGFLFILRYLKEAFIVTINMCRDDGTALITVFLATGRLPALMCCPRRPKGLRTSLRSAAVCLTQRTSVGRMERGSQDVLHFSLG